MADKVYIQNGGIFLEPDSATEAVFVSNGQIHLQPDGAKDVVTDKYIVGGTVFGDNDSTNVKMIGPDGQMLMTGPATYTAQAAGGLGIPIAAYHYNHHLRR